MIIKFYRNKSNDDAMKEEGAPDSVKIVYECDSYNVSKFCAKDDDSKDAFIVSVIKDGKEIIKVMIKDHFEKFFSCELVTELANVAYSQDGSGNTIDKIC